jgi:hypothetical protein
MATPENNGCDNGKVSYLAPAATPGEPTFQQKLRVGSRITNHAKRQLRRDWYHEFTKEGGAFVKHCPDGMTTAQFAAAVMIDRALKGDFQFFRELLDRTEGKVPNRIAGADGKNLPQSISVVQVMAPQVSITATVLEAVSRVLELQAPPAEPAAPESSEGP